MTFAISVRAKQGSECQIHSNNMSRFVACFMLLAVLAGCGRPVGPSHATDITGAMPPLQFRMTRASDGADVTAADYRGHVTILYFGYTNCPDICPATLANLAGMLGRLGRDADKVRVLFVTVDPNRDTLPVLKQYRGGFRPPDRRIARQRQCAGRSGAALSRRLQRDDRAQIRSDAFHRRVFLRRHRPRHGW